MSAAHDYSHDPAPPPAEPHSIDVEQALLGAILCNNAAYERVASFLLPEHFYDPIHRQIFEVCAARIKDGRLADVKTIKTHLAGLVLIKENDGKIGEITITEYVTHLAYEGVTIINAEDYGRTIIDLSIRRAMIHVAKDTITTCQESDYAEPSAKLIGEVEGWFAELRQSHKVASTNFSPANAVRGAMEMIGEAHAGRRVGWPWLLSEVRMVMDGPALPGRLYGLLGASGDGKTSFVLQSLRILAEQGVPFLFLSGEQEPEECVLQMHAQRLGIPLADMLKQDGLKDDEADLIFEDAQAIAKLPWAIEKWTACKVSQLGMKIRGFVKRYGPGVVAIDHAKKILPDNPKESNLAQTVAQVFGGVKDLMGENGCAGILIMQRNSDFLKRRNMWPIRSDCYGGEGTLQNLDGCLTLFRAARWLRESLVYVERGSEREKIERRITEEEGRAWFGNLKNRFGEENRRHKVIFEARFTRFVSFEQRRLEREPELPV